MQKSRRGWLAGIYWILRPNSDPSPNLRHLPMASLGVAVTVTLSRNSNAGGPPTVAEGDTVVTRSLTGPTSHIG
jgi:hypothetical protein